MDASGRLLLVLAACVFALFGCGDTPDHRVLFVGNSYTHSNELPATVERIAANALLAATR